MISLVTACAGGIDPALPLPAHPPGVTSIYFRDEPLPPDVAATWSKSLPIQASADPRLAAKRIKCRLPFLPEVSRAERLVWADSCMEFSDLGFLLDWADLSVGERAVLVPHPDRKTVAEEYEYVLGQLRARSRYLTSRYAIEPLERERDHFARSHDLSKLPLWAGGVWMFPQSYRSRLFFDSWWEVVQQFSIFDQCAISPLLVEHGIEVVSADVHLYRNAHFTRRPHP